LGTFWVVIFLSKTISVVGICNVVQLYFMLLSFSFLARQKWASQKYFEDKFGSKQNTGKTFWCFYKLQVPHTIM